MYRLPSSIEQSLDFLIDVGFTEVQVDKYFETSDKSPSKIKESYDKLKELGISDSRIVSFRAILKVDSEILQRRYENLIKLGFPRTKISFHANLLERPSETINPRYRALQELGFKNEIIQRRTELLLIPTESLLEHYKILKRQGLTRKLNTSFATILAQDPRYIIRNNQAHRRLIQGRLLETFVQLNSIPIATIEGNVQFANYLGIKYDDGIFLGTHPGTKRKKMAWILREIMNYRDVAEDEKKVYRNALRRYISENPGILKLGIPKLEEIKENLMLQIYPYVLKEQ